MKKLTKEANEIEAQIQALDKENELQLSEIDKLDAKIGQD